MSTGWVVPPEEVAVERAVEAANRDEADDQVEPLLEGVATWSTAKILPLAVAMGVAVAVFIFWVSPDPALIEWQLTVLTLAILLCGFLTVGLYRGVQLERSRKRPHIRLPGLPESGGDGFNLGDLGGDGEGWLVVLALIALIVVAAVFLQALLVIVPPVLFGLYRGCDRILRLAFAGPRTCTGSWPGSLKLGLAYSGYAIGAVFAATWLVRAAWLAVSHS